MPARQLQFFGHAKPLLKIFDREFFRAVPRAAGVYVMTGKGDRVLYVGQSGNLRQRLATYKNCNPNQLTRKVIRLMHQVEKLSWETCDSVRDARLRENALLRLHRPKFNVMNVYPKIYAFIAVEFAGQELKLWIEREETRAGELYGAFKGTCRLAFAALARTLWSAVHKPLSPQSFPCGVLDPGLRRFRIELSREARELAPMLRAYLLGNSTALVQHLRSMLPPLARLSPFQQQLHAADLALLDEFFAAGPERNRRMLEQTGITEPLILQDQLDDLIVKAGVCAQGR